MQKTPKTCTAEQCRTTDVSGQPIPFASEERWCLFMQPRGVWNVVSVSAGWGGQAQSWRWLFTHGTGEGGTLPMAKLLCNGWEKAITSMPHPSQTSAPSQAGSRISCYNLCNRSIDDSRCFSSAFPSHCLFLRVRFVPCFLFSLSSLLWTLEFKGFRINHLCENGV